MENAGRVTECFGVVGNIFDDHRTGADEGVGANRYPRDAGTLRAEHRSRADGHVASQPNARTEMSMRSDLSVMVNATTCVEDAVFRNDGVRVHDDTTENDGSRADFR